jgi:hydrogenase nickel incorporation protein HypA/HybF
MHELAIAESILDAVRKELAAYPGAIPIRVGVKIGALAAVDMDALGFCFEIAVRGTGWDRLKLDARMIPGEVTCLACGHKMQAESTVLDCELCHSAQTVMHGTDELDIDALEIERDDDNGTDLAETEGFERKPEDCGQPA